MVLFRRMKPQDTSASDSEQLNMSGGNLVRLKVCVFFMLAHLINERFEAEKVNILFWKAPFSVGFILYVRSSLPHVMSLNMASVGLLLGLAMLQPPDMQELHAQLSLLFEQYDFNIPELPGLDFSRMEVEWHRLRSNIPEVWKFNNDGREFQVGERMKERGLTAQHPVVLIPGVISTVRLVMSSFLLMLMLDRAWSLGLLLLNFALSSARNCGEDLKCFLK